MRELDDVVDMRLAEAGGQGCSPRITAVEQRVERLVLELRRLRTALALIGHLTGQGAGGSKS